MQKRRFTVAGFEGPLDLLWYLIKQNEVNIFDIPIAEITAQYMEYLDYMKDEIARGAQTGDSLLLSDLSEFYKWAAFLLKIKSAMLLPAPTLDDNSEGDPRQSLVEKLIEYQKFRQLASRLEEKEDTKLWGFDGGDIERDEGLWESGLYQKESPPPKIDPALDLPKMQRLYSQIMRRVSNNAILETYELITVNEKVTLLKELLKEGGVLNFRALITRKGNKMDTICAFMAALEQVKTKLVRLEQVTLFGEISILRV